MKTNLYVNLPVEDVTRSRNFFSKLGFSINETYSNDDAICVELNELTSVMLLKNEFFATFISLPLAEAKQKTAVLLAISLESREGVEAFFQQAIALGASEAREPQDYGYMFSRSFHDLDGHIWEPFYMNEKDFPAA